MSKLRTAFSLLAAGDHSLLRRQLLIYFRSLYLTRRTAPFTYSLHGVPFACYPSSPESTDLYLARKIDPEELRLLRTWLHPGDTCIDAGANLGVYLAAAAHTVGPTGSCLGIEASPATAARLRETLALLNLNNVHLEAVAVGATVSETIFHQALPGVATDEQSLLPPASRLADYTPVTIRQETLAALIARHPALSRPALVKIDIEGAERAALSAAPAPWFAPDGPLWIVELNPAALARFDSTCNAVAACFPSSAFHRVLLPQYPHDPRHALPPRLLTPVETYTDALYYNLVALPRANPRSAALLAKLAP